ncbi:hypothetical protein RHSIM_Rhsim11G0031900 [Rhododendron simsii]|uniref:Myb/SANT-like domain-containing protein n=1 Tax=Rhododendron simsii TaxID=118357 RepID=A0A834LAD7_RHOSS|nr:hypothetical protein RHSIM_Rhsim11G0031900 [Rhododendron simsii]
MAHNDVMEVSGESSDGPWTTRNEKIFIQLMDEEVKSKKSRETGTFIGEAWKRIRSELIRLTGYSYTKEQVKNKYNALRILFNKFNSLNANSGVGWDSTLLTVTAPDDVWERLFKVRFHPLCPEILASGSLDHEVQLWLDTFTTGWLEIKWR